MWPSRSVHSPSPARGVVGDERVLDARLLKRGRKLLGRVRAPGAFREYVHRRPLAHWRLAPLVREHEPEPLVEEEVAALKRRRARPQRGEQLGGLGGGRKRDEHGDPGPEARRQLPAHAGDDPERPLGADEQVREAVSGVVLREAREPRDDRAVGEHGFEPRHPGSRGPVPQRPRTAGIAGDDAADRARVPRREIESGVVVRRTSRRLQRGEGRPGADRHLSERLIDLLDRVEPGERHDDLTVPRHPATDEPGVPALGHDRGAGPSARHHHGGHLGCARGPHDESCAPHVPARVVALVPGQHLGVAQHVARADSVTEGLFELRHYGWPATRGNTAGNRGEKPWLPSGRRFSRWRLRR